MAKRPGKTRGNEAGSAQSIGIPAPQIDFVRQELVGFLDTYAEIRDCLDGQKAIKLKGERYLRKPNPTDKSAENLARYEDYLARAVFYNVTGRTLQGLTGQIFLREPTSNTPDQLKAVMDDATGEGVSVEQLAKTGCNYVLAYGRAGLLVDYPETDGTATTVQQQQDGGIRSTLHLFAPWKVINWRWSRRGSLKILSLVVIEENIEAVGNDGFATTTGTQWRVLRLVPDVDLFTGIANTMERAEVSLWETDNQGSFVTTKVFYPKDGNGKPLDVLPFSFIGVESNSTSVDNPPLADMAAINIGHYRNSADYEESCYICGQPTVWLSGLTTEWFNRVLKGKVEVGARSAIPLPIEGKAGMIQANPNSQPYEAMQLKERQMVALGAKLIQQATVQRTATETDIENTSESSTLGAAAKNVSAAFELALKWAAMFMRVPSDGITYSLNTSFDLTYMDFNELLAIVQAWQGNAITDEEMRANLRRAGIASEDDRTAIPALQKKAQDAAAAALAAKKTIAGNNPNKPGSNNPSPTKPASGAAT